jgi:hypothetical protein
MTQRYVSPHACVTGKNHGSGNHVRQAGAGLRRRRRRSICPEPRQSVQAAGCPERFDLAFYRWIWNYERDSRPRLDDALERHDHLDVVELRTRTAMSRFLDDVALR